MGKNTKKSGFSNTFVFCNKKNNNTTNNKQVIDVLKFVGFIQKKKHSYYTSIRIERRCVLVRAIVCAICVYVRKGKSMNEISEQQKTTQFT